MLEGQLALYNVQLSQVPEAPVCTMFDCQTLTHCVSQMAEKISFHIINAYFFMKWNMIP